MHKKLRVDDFFLFFYFKVLLISKLPTFWDISEGTFYRKHVKLKGALSMFADPTEVSNGKEIEASDWSNLRFTDPPGNRTTSHRQVLTDFQLGL